MLVHNSERTEWDVLMARLNGIVFFQAVSQIPLSTLHQQYLSIRMVLIGQPFSEEHTVFFVLREKLLSHWDTWDITAVGLDTFI